MGEGARPDSGGRLGAAPDRLEQADGCRRRFSTSAADGPHSPGFHQSASELLAHDRDVLGVGVETVGTDAGQAGTFDPPFPNHTIMHGAGKFGLASLTQPGPAAGHRRHRDRRAAQDRRRKREPAPRAGDRSGMSRQTGVERNSGASPPPRETFASRFGALMTIIGVAVGLGNVWRFPYMVGMFGGAAFVLFYVVVSVVIGVPALMAEFALGRHTRRGPVGAFAAGGLPFGRQAGWFFFFIVTAATGYYSAVIGWVLYYALAQAASAFQLSLDAPAILPPTPDSRRRVSCCSSHAPAR